MTTREPPEPLDPQEVLAAAEAAHLAARRTVRIALDRSGGQPPVPPEPDELRRSTPADGPPQDRTSAEGTPAGPTASEPVDVAQRETVDLRRVLPRSGGGVPGQVRPAGSRRPRRRAPLVVAAGVASLWAGLVTFVPIAVVIMLIPLAEGGAPAWGGSVRLAAAGWLLAHGVPIQTEAGTIGLVPLAVSALAAWRVVRAGVHVTRTRGARAGGPLRQALLAAVAVAAGYGGLGGLMALVAGGTGWGPELARAVLTLAGFGLVWAAYGAVRTTGAGGALVARLALVSASIRAGLVAAAGVLAAGAALAGSALAVSAGPATELVAAYGANVAGQAGLVALCLVYAPNVAIWAASYLVGPGFAVGADTVVRSSEVMLGPVPALPVFAALPDGPVPAGLATALLAVPVLAGSVAGWLLARQQLRWLQLVVGAVLVGVVAGAVLGLAAAAAGGPLGSGQLAVVGPEPVAVALATAATVAAGALLGALTGWVLARRRHG